jgi:hypothetical protein
MNFPKLSNQLFNGHVLNEPAPTSEPIQMDGALMNVIFHPHVNQAG